MKNAVLVSAVLALTSTIAYADGPRFSFVDVGLFGADSNDYDGDEARFRVRGSIGAGDVIYIPLAIESTAIEFDDDYSITDVVFSAGIGARISPIENMAFYGDASLAAQSISYDEDGGFDDEDSDDDGSGLMLRGGWRFQPTDKVELIAELSKRRISLDDSEDTVKRSLVAVQVNFSPMFGLGLEYHRDKVSIDYDFGLEGGYATRFYGAYFRFSFR